MQYEVGQRVDIFKVTTPYGGYWEGDFKQGSWYSEVPGNQFHENQYGRDMICDNPDYKKLHCSISDGSIKLVGTMIITKLK